VDAPRIVPLTVGTLLLDAVRLEPGRGDGAIGAPVTIWLVEAGGLRVLVDTGPSDEPAAHRHGHRQYRRSPADAPGDKLRAAGVDPDSVDLVVLTHLHWDHAYNNRLLPRARFLVQAVELAYARRPEPEQHVYYEHGLAAEPYFAGTPYELVDGACDLGAGLHLIPLPGHTPGSQGLVVDSAAGRYVIAGDTVPLVSNLRTGRPSSIATDPGAFARSLALLAAMDAVVFPSHDPLLAPFDGRDLVAAHQDWLAALDSAGLSAIEDPSWTAAEGSRRLQAPGATTEGTRWPS
jgi:glyoxylase-like metal-dependent hydrolase (beta-lactamase superfamily II)